MVIRQITGTEALYTQYFNLPPLDPGGRLSLSPTDPVGDGPNTDGFNTTVYYIPFINNAIPFYSTARTAWGVRTFSTLSLSLTGLAVGCYDLFVRVTGSTLSLVSTPWQNTTTRVAANAPTADRYLIRGTTKTDLWVGSLYVPSVGQCQDGVPNRFLWNAYNRVDKRIFRTDPAGTTQTPTANTWVLWNGSTLNRIGMINGNVSYTPAPRSTFRANIIFASQSAGGDYAYFGQGLDTGVANPDPLGPYAFAGAGLSPTFGFQFTSEKFVPIPVGYHWLQAAVQRSGANVSFNFLSLGGLEMLWEC